MNLEPKTASLNLRLLSLTGFRSNETHSVSIDQYEAICRILAGLPTADEAKLKDRIAELEEFIRSAGDEA